MPFNTGVAYNDIVADNKTKLISGTSLIVKELELLLNFPKYSLFFGNNMGLDLERYLHLKNNQATFNLIKSDIEKLFAKYGKAYLQKVEVVFNVDGSLTITLTVSADTSGRNTFQIPFTVSD